MSGKLTFDGKHLRFDAERRAATEADYRLWLAWQERYGALCHPSVPDAGLLLLGQEMWGWLNESFGPAASRWRDGSTGDRVLEVGIPAGKRGDMVVLFLDLPWEVLATERGHFAADPRDFALYRRIGKAGEALAPSYQDLGLLFMAAAPEGTGELDYQKEEHDILAATRGTRHLQLTVEETGALAFLPQSFDDGGPFQMLHLTCHGIFTEDEAVLVLEDSGGARDLVTARQLVDAMPSDANRPLALFLSACHTADGGTAAAPLSLDLIEKGIPSVLGWGSFVQDDTAIAASEELYKHLSNHGSVTQAAARTRRTLLTNWQSEENERDLRHWHLLRVFAGPEGGGPLTEARKGPRPNSRANEAGHKEMLAGNKAVPVASRGQFVARRREAQAAIRHLRSPRNLSVMLQAIGGQGKSSLAARIANRLPGLKPVACFGEVEVADLLRALSQALPLEQYDRVAANQTLAEKDPEFLERLLVDLLEGPFAAPNPDEKLQPILLILDDLEQMLEPQTARDNAGPVRPEFQGLLRAVLSTFARAETRSRLLLTSRHDFTLVSQTGHDLTRALEIVPVRALGPRDTHRLTQAWLRDKGYEADAIDETLAARLLAAARGNAGLQALMIHAAVTEPETAQRMLNAYDRYMTDGQVPDDDDEARAWIARVALDTYLDVLTPDQAQAVDALTFLRDRAEDRPWPLPADVVEDYLTRLALDAGVVLRRLSGLGLVEHSRIDGDGRMSLNALAFTRRRATAQLNDEEEIRLATQAKDALAAHLGIDNGDFPQGPDSELLAELALTAGDRATLGLAANAACRVLYEQDFKLSRALDLARRAMAAFDEETPAPIRLVRIAADCAGRAGHGQEATKLLHAAVSRPPTRPDAGHAILWKDWGLLLHSRGQSDEAMQWIEQAISFHLENDDDRDRAIAWGAKADILYQRGELDEALRIRTEEQIPVYDAIGDRRSRAVTMGKIADILYQRGELDEALRIRTEEQIPVYDAIGDRRERAVTMGQIADILYQRGELDEALRIRTEEEIPVYDAIGDRRERAVTIAKMGRQHGGQLGLNGARACLTEAHAIFQSMGLAEARIVEGWLREMDGLDDGS